MITTCGWPVLIALLPANKVGTSFMNDKTGLCLYHDINSPHVKTSCITIG
jgi:hypothetical protein